jgi:hypothetical protein
MSETFSGERDCFVKVKFMEHTGTTRLLITQFKEEMITVQWKILLEFKKNAFENLCVCVCVFVCVCVYVYTYTHTNTVELGYNFMKGIFCVVIIVTFNVMVNREELISTTEHLTL